MIKTTPGATIGRVMRWIQATPAWTKLALALVLGIGLGYGPTIGQGQPPAHAGPPLASLPAAAQNALGGNSIALVRVVKHDDPANPIATWGRGANPTNSITDEPKEEDVDFTVTSDADGVYVSGTLLKDYFRDFGPPFGQPGDPVEVIAVSVVLKVGNSTCYWDCYYVNGVRKCQCINL
jgi:hypothetical protein